MKIKRSQILKGKNKFLNLKIARLPSGIEIHMGIHVFRSEKEGPVVLLSGGLHGDEVNGIEIVRRFINSNIPSNLLCGSIVAIPIINVFGFLNFSREVPDGKDVNRSFPGSKEGSLASLVAYNISEYILPVIDYGIDYHTGGAKRVNFPQVRYNVNDPKAFELAQKFGVPFILGNETISGSLRWQAAKQDKPIIVYEGGESMRMEEDAIEQALFGTENVLKHLGMVEGELIEKECTHISKSTWIRSPRSGLYRAEKLSGDYVHKGEILAVIYDPFGKYAYPVSSKHEGYIIGHNNLPVVHKGDALFHLGIKD
ncbi:MAG: succinylglutamate desuccinylase [Chitinophagaceae bacterium]|nr:MAG: succinylglutamate desuccinylase [Chitinophagaceae bacterium]